jgi:tryptophan 2,3-dioxygenase
MIEDPEQPAPAKFFFMEDGNDEMLFIIIHQAYELWFKQIIFELDLVRNTSSSATASTIIRTT